MKFSWSHKPLAGSPERREEVPDEGRGAFDQVNGPTKMFYSWEKQGKDNEVIMVFLTFTSVPAKSTSLC
jgi:hypothetical protein